MSGLNRKPKGVPKMSIQRKKSECTNPKNRNSLEGTHKNSEQFVAEET